MAQRADVERYRENWQDEVDSASEYSAMAESEPDSKIAKVYSNLAKMEEVHIAFWEDRLRSAGESVGERRPSWRSRVIASIARRFGPDAVLSTIAAKEAADRNVYVKQPETSGTRMSAKEQWHTRVLGQLLRTQPRGLSGRQFFSASGPNGRAKFANRDFGRELPITFRKVVFSATTHLQMRPLVRAIQ